MIRGESIFNYARSELVGKSIKIITPKEIYLGRVIRCDQEGNFSIDTEKGLVLIQRKFIIAIEVLP